MNEMIVKGEKVGRRGRMVELKIDREEQYKGRTEYGTDGGGWEWYMELGRGTEQKGKEQNRRIGRAEGLGGGEKEKEQKMSIIYNNSNIIQNNICMYMYVYNNI